MAKIHRTLATIIVVFSFATVVINAYAQQLQVGFYDGSCPNAEKIVFEEVSKAYSTNPGIAAGLIRMHFHDCFVRGCDGSVLIDTIDQNNVAEKDSPANNPSLRGFEVVDSAKSRLETVCPRTVSCADILAFAARDGANKASKWYNLKWDVPAGRRDGVISRASEIPGNLPPPTSNVDQLTQLFAVKGLSQEEMVILSGSHTIGRSHCSSFIDRLYNFNGTNSTDPSLNPILAVQLKSYCPRGNPNNSTTVFMESETPFILDNKYYGGVRGNRGLFSSDATLLTNPTTKSVVLANSGFFSSGLWQNKFAKAMVKMGQIGVLTGNQGEIRLNCRFVNS